MKNIKVRHKFTLSRLVFFPTCRLLHFFLLLFLSRWNVLMLLKAPMCGVTTARMNKVKPRTHKCISATALEKIIEKQRQAVCAPRRPVYLSSWRRSYFLQWLHHQLWFSGTLYLPAWPLSLAGIRATPDLKDRNVVMAVILGQQGDLRPLPEWLLWVADFKVPGVKLEQSEHFYLDFKCISKYKHINLGKRWKRGHNTHFKFLPFHGGRGGACSSAAGGIMYLSADPHMNHWVGTG